MPRLIYGQIYIYSFIVWIDENIDRVVLHDKKEAGNGLNVSEIPTVNLNVTISYTDHPLT